MFENNLGKEIEQVKKETEPVGPDYPTNLDNDLSRLFKVRIKGGWSSPKEQGGVWLRRNVDDEFDYNNKVYHNLDEHSKYYMDLADRYSKLALNPPQPPKGTENWNNDREKAYYDALAKEYAEKGMFLANNREGLQPYVDHANATRKTRTNRLWMHGLRNFKDLQRMYRKGTLTIDDIKEILDEGDEY